MTANRAVNPKKLRPYDQPPKRRRSLIPGGPDSAATGFLVAAALWLALATAIGLLAIGVRLLNFTFTFPLGVFDLSFTLDARRVDAGFMNATVYGWLTNAGFAAIAFMTPRLTGQRIVGEAWMNVGLAIWNLTLLGGLGALYVFDLGPHGPLTAMPWLFLGGLAGGAFLFTAVFAVSAARSLARGYISLWFATVALLGLLGLLGLAATAALVDFIIGLDDLLLALGSAFVGTAIATIWLLGMAYAVLHYVVPRASGQPLASGGLATLTFLTWLVLAPGAAVGVLVDRNIPFLLTTAGSVAAMLLIVPATLTVGNLVATLRGRGTLLFSAGASAMATVALAFLLAGTLLDGIGALRDVQRFVGGTEWARGAAIWTLYGTCTLAALALIEHATPRLLRRAWGGGLLAGVQLWTVFIGTTISGLALMGSGLAEGAFRAQAAAPDVVSAGIVGYRAAALGGFALVALGGLALLANLFFMYTSGRPAEYVVPGQPAAAAAGH